MQPSDVFGVTPTPTRMSRRALAMQAPKIFIWQRPEWPAMTWDAQAVQSALQQAQRAQAQLSAALKGIGFEGLQSINRDLWSQEALATASIEGQDLDLQAVRSSVGHRLGLGMPASADRSVEGLVQVMQEAMQHTKPLTAKRLCAWQALLFPDNEAKPLKLQVIVGRFRTHREPMQIISGSLGKEVIHYTAPPSDRVAQLMQQLLYWLHITSPSADPASSAGLHRPAGLVRAALAHLWFEAIHPFEDGNGRVGRALADHVLAQELATTQRVLSLSWQLQVERKDYYQQLAAVTAGSRVLGAGIDVTPWVLWFLGVFARGCEHSLAVIRHSADASAFWQRCAQFDLNERQRKVLARLLEAGDGGFLGGLSAHKYIKLTGASKATATRDLAQLLQSGLLAIQGQGKGTRYAIALANWHQDFERYAAPSAPQEAS